MKIITLQHIYNNDLELSEKQRDSLIELLCNRLHSRNRQIMQRLIELGPQYFCCYLKSWMMDRIHFDSDGIVSYCAGQDYPGELSNIKQTILKR